MGGRPEKQLCGSTVCCVSLRAAEEKLARSLWEFGMYALVPISYACADLPPVLYQRFFTHLFIVVVVIVHVCMCASMHVL